MIDDLMLYCYECKADVKKFCTKHAIQWVFNRNTKCKYNRVNNELFRKYLSSTKVFKCDCKLNGKKHVQNTLPESLCIMQSDVCDNILGVWSKKFIKKGTIFGPFVGITYKVNKVDDCIFERSINGNVWLIRSSDDSDSDVIVDAENLLVSNWMRFVRCCKSSISQNFVAIQYDGLIFFRACEDINAETELTVFYGIQHELDVETDKGREILDPPLIIDPDSNISIKKFLSKFDRTLMSPYRKLCPKHENFKTEKHSPYLSVTSTSTTSNQSLSTSTQQQPIVEKKSNFLKKSKRRRSSAFEIYKKPSGFVNAPATTGVSIVPYPIQEYFVPQLYSYYPVAATAGQPITVFPASQPQQHTSLTNNVEFKKPFIDITKQSLSTRKRFHPIAPLIAKTNYQTRPLTANKKLLEKKVHNKKHAIDEAKIGSKSKMIVLQETNQQNQQSAAIDLSISSKYDLSLSSSSFICYNNDDFYDSPTNETMHVDADNLSIKENIGYYSSLLQSESSDYFLLDDEIRSSIIRICSIEPFISIENILKCIDQHQQHCSDTDYKIDLQRSQISSLISDLKLRTKNGVWFDIDENVLSKIVEIFHRNSSMTLDGVRIKLLMDYPEIMVPNLDVIRDVIHVNCTKRTF